MQLLPLSSVGQRESLTGRYIATLLSYITIVDVHSEQEWTGILESSRLQIFVLSIIVLIQVS